jgi:hypothetical protein
VVPILAESQTAGGSATRPPVVPETVHRLYSLVLYARPLGPERAGVADALLCIAFDQPAESDLERAVRTPTG